jgi:hypothetical protein
MKRTRRSGNLSICGGGPVSSTAARRACAGSVPARSLGTPRASSSSAATTLNHTARLHSMPALGRGAWRSNVRTSCRTAVGSSCICANLGFEPPALRQELTSPTRNRLPRPALSVRPLRGHGADRSGPPQPTWVLLLARSIEAARRAGARHAMTATASRKTVTPPRISGSPRALGHPASQRRHAPAQQNLSERRRVRHPPGARGQSARCRPHGALRNIVEATLSNSRHRRTPASADVPSVGQRFAFKGVRRMWRAA